MQSRQPASRATPEPAPDEGKWEATVARDVLVGQQLDGYVIKRRIGAGGMGIVYEAEHSVIGRKAAIKILRPELTEGAQARDLVAEARAASAIRHRGIIDIFGFGTLPAVGQYLVMEYLEGTPLNELIAQRAPLEELETVALLDELLSALAAAHAMGVIHRDLKPGNIFVTRDTNGTESVKVLDFGLAKRSAVPNGTTPQTRASLIVGTPEYIAPEQATGQAVGPHTDLYAVGLIAFEMLTRRLPFEGTSAMAIIVQHMQKEPPAPSSFVEVHPELEALVLRLLAKEPAGRPASADEVRRELKRIRQQLSEGAPAVARPPSSPSVPQTGRFGEALVSPTLVRPTPAVPLSARASSPASARASRVVPPAPAPAAEVAPSAELAPAPRPGRTPLLLVAGGAAVLAALGGWFMRGQGLPADAPPPGLHAPLAEAHRPPPPPPHFAPPPPPPREPFAAPMAGAPQAPPSVPAAPEPDREERPSTPSMEKGTLQLVVRGSGVVWVDGKRMGEVPPLNRLDLSPGLHTLEVRNPRAEPFITQVRITAGQTLRQRVALRRRRG